jgi:hypothetical protein
MAKLTRGAAKLFALDMSGVKNELADIRDTAEKGALDREELGALNLRKQICQTAAEVIGKELGHAEVAELTAELRATREAMKNQGSGSTSFDSDTLALPRRAGEGSFTQ